MIPNYKQSCKKITLKFNEPIEQEILNNFGDHCIFCNAANIRNAFTISCINCNYYINFTFEFIWVIRYNCFELVKLANDRTFALYHNKSWKRLTTLDIDQVDLQTLFNKINLSSIDNISLIKDLSIKQI